MKPLIIFDLDGVIIDSEYLYFNMTRNLFKSLKIDISIDEQYNFVGISAKIMWSYLKEQYSLNYSVEELIGIEKEQKFRILNSYELQPIQGVVNFIERLKQENYKIAIASSGMKKNVDLILQKLRINNSFDYVVTGEQVEKGKPDPDIFLVTADKFRVHPSNCIVIEDSNNGVTAAKKAGMVCIGVINSNSGNQDLSHADLRIDKFDCKYLFDFIQFTYIKNINYAGMEL